MDRLVYERMNEQEAVHWWFTARRKIIGATIERLIKPSPEADILEAGCGTGGNLEMLMGYGTLDAFEFDSVAREIAAEKSQLEVPFGTLPDDIPFGSKTYDLIGLFDVLEHIEDDEATLAQLGKRLKSDGKILVTVPAFPWLWSQHDERHHHFRRYTRKSLKTVAENNGLKVEECFYFNSLLLPVAIGLRALKAITRSDAPDDTMPSPWLNKLLYTVFSWERNFIGRIHLPLGLSVCAVLKQAQPEDMTNQ